MATTADVLKDSLALLREGGWIKGRLRDEKGAHCAVGALVQCTARSRLSLYSSADERLSALAAQMFPDRADQLSPLVLLNNHPDTTFEDIEAIFEKAILQEGGTL